MTYRKKLALLSSVAGALALLYAGLLAASPERLAARNAYYTWIDRKAVARVERAEISGASSVSLVRRDGVWFAEENGELFPAKGGRMEELLSLLSSRGSFPVRVNSAGAHERLGLGDASPKRIVLLAGAVPVLDLIVGDYDAAGMEVYYRRAGQNQVRSGGGTILEFVNYAKNSWYDLRLFPEETAVADIERVTVISPQGGEPFVAARNGGSWSAGNLPSEKIDTTKIEPWIRAILQAEGDGYVPAEDDSFSGGRILVEGGGRTLYLRLGRELPPLQEGQQPRHRARVSVSERVFSLSSWTVDRLFRDAAYFTRTE